MAEPYKAPVIILKPKQETEIPFSGVLAANTQNTFISSGISAPFKVKGVKMYFRDDSASLVLMYWLVSGSPDTSTTGLPSGDNVFRNAVGLPYFALDAGLRVCLADYEVEEGVFYLKLHVNNTCAYAMTFHASAIIEKV